MNEAEVKEKLEQLRKKAPLEIHEWNSVKGKGIIVDDNGNIYDYKWFLGMNMQTNNFGMCTELDKRKNKIDFKELLTFLENTVSKEYNINGSDDEGWDIIINHNGVNKVYNNKELYNELYKKVN